MPIEHHAHGGTTMTGESIDFFALGAQLGAAKLEAKGIKMHRRGPALWKYYRDHYQIPGTGKKRASEAQVIAWMQAKVDELRPQQRHITHLPDGTLIEEGGDK